MNFGRRSSQITSKFTGTYAKLFQGQTPHQIAPLEDPELFFSNLLDLEVKREYLEEELNRATKTSCLQGLKSFLAALFRACVTHGQGASHGDVRKSHALITLSIVIRSVLAKNLTGWEVMEIFAGGVGQSDTVFMAFTAMVNDLLSDETAPATVRHQALQSALTYMCGVGQLSPGAYFLRCDLFPSISIFIKSPDTTQFAFEAVLFLAILANFHKSDAARLNPYLSRIKETRDGELMRKICWASNFALDAAARAFQDISDDSVKQTFPKSFGALISSLRPDRALALAPLDPPRELFKDQPIEATVILLPVFEFLYANPIFTTIFLESTSSRSNKSESIPPLPFTILTLSSYLLTHASSISSPRSFAYANLCLNVLLSLVEKDEVMDVFFQSNDFAIHLCRQRLPLLSVPRPRRPPVCALLDCCVLWLRHNLHKRLEVYSYTKCIWICYRVIWYLQKNTIRLDYEWKELWSALIGLLNFLSSKLDSLATTGGVEQVVRETVMLLDLSLCKSETYLPSPTALHEYIYELVRSSSILKSQVSLLKSLALPHPSPQRMYRITSGSSDSALAGMLEIVDFYEQKVNEAGAQTAKAAMGVVSKEIEADGLHGAKALRQIEGPLRSEDVLAFGRIACLDGLALMP